MNGDQRQFLARRLRDAYSMHRRRYDELYSGVASSWGDRVYARYDGKSDDDGQLSLVDSTWSRVIDALAMHFDPLPIMYCVAAALFEDALLKERPPPEPDAMLHPAFVGIVEGHVRKRLDASVRELLSQKIVLEARLAVDMRNGKAYQDAMRSAAADAAMPFTSLFRYCALVNAGYFDDANRWKAQAVSQYVAADSFYDATWVGWLPAGIRDEKEVVEWQRLTR